jgi:DNA processing protein
MQNLDDSILKHAVELTLVPGIGSINQNKLWARFGRPSDLFRSGARELESWGVPHEASSALVARRYRAKAEEIVTWGKHDGYQFFVRGMCQYPPLLDEIQSPPLVLYARGSPEVLNQPCIAIVGTRRPTCYGLQMAEGLAADLGSRGITVVSGMARGIDAAAHRGCIQSTGNTVAVFGCGIDIIYPREHQLLANQIRERGLILSEFPPGTSPSPQNFPVRNRIISGLSTGTLIIEASEYSGSLITARMALEQNRDVFALPGNLTSPQSFGPNYLIKQGAKLVQSWRDIVEELPQQIRHQILADQDTRTGARNQELDLLTDEESRVLAQLDTDQATQFDKIYKLCRVGLSDLSSILLNLEMRGWIRQVPGNLFVKLARPRK